MNKYRELQKMVNNINNPDGEILGQPLSIQSILRAGRTKYGDDFTPGIIYNSPNGFSITNSVNYDHSDVDTFFDGPPDVEIDLSKPMNNQGEEVYEKLIKLLTE